LGAAVGPEVLEEPSMEYELYYPERSLYLMDRYVDLARKYGIYLKIVLMEKNDLMYDKLDGDGSFVIGGEPDNANGI
jgi:hypothetical protein